MDAGEQQPLATLGLQQPVELAALEGREEGLVQDRLAGLRKQLRRRLVAGRALLAQPAVVALPGRHAPVVGAGDGRPRVHHRDPELAAAAEQRRRALHDASRGRLQAGRGEVVALEVDQEQQRLHSATSAAAASPSRSATSRVPSCPPRSSVLPPLAQSERTASSMAHASRSRPRLSRSISASERIWPTGLARPLPAMSWAAPWFVW